VPARPLRSLCAIGAAALTGCGAPSSSAPPSPVVADPCAVVAQAASPFATVRVALLTPVAPANAPVPGSDAERLVFRQLYETLVRVDCAGVVRPGLARRWRAEDGGTRWIFELWPGARFWDGTPVDAAALRASWGGDRALAVEDVQSSGVNAVAVSLHSPRPIEAFGDAAWSVVKRILESPWPLGTGPVWTGGWEGEGLLRATPLPDAPQGTPLLEFRTAVAADPRDVLDQPADVIVTRDAGTVRYAAGRGDWRVVPLPWDRVYVLASPLRVRSGVTVQLDSAAQVSLARDAVRDDARVPEQDAWWADSRCPPDVLAPAARPDPMAQAPSTAVILPAGDRVAGDLVARLVARADAELADLLGSRPRGLRAGPAGPADYAAALAAGHASAFVVPLPRHPLDACRAAVELRASAPWLHADGVWAGDALAALIETRAHLLVRDVPVAHLERDGGVRLVPVRHP